MKEQACLLLDTVTRVFPPPSSPGKLSAPEDSLLAIGVTEARRREKGSVSFSWLQGKMRQATPSHLDPRRARGPLGTYMAPVNNLPLCPASSMEHKHSSLLNLAQSYQCTVLLPGSSTETDLVTVVPDPKFCAPCICPSAISFLPGRLSENFLFSWASYRASEKPFLACHWLKITFPANKTWSFPWVLFS